MALIPYFRKCLMCSPDSDPSNPSPAVAEFDVNTTTGEAPLTVSFSDNSSNAISWLWDFGDGEFSTERSPVHTYQRATTYTVTLIVNGAGGSDSKTATIKVTEPMRDSSGGDSGGGAR